MPWRENGGCQSNGFWRTEGQCPLTASEVALYALLVNECNSRFWRQPFTLGTTEICRRLQMSRQTVVTARQRLVERHVIAFTPGRSRTQLSNFSLLDLTVDLTLNNIKTKIEDRKEIKRKDFASTGLTQKGKGFLSTLNSVPTDEAYKEMKERIGYGQKHS